MMFGWSGCAGVCVHVLAIQIMMVLLIFDRAVNVCSSDYN